MSVLVLMKALPFTKGHEALLRFAQLHGNVTVLMDFASDEPLVPQRYAWIKETFPSVRIVQPHVEPQSEADDPGFWDLWEKILRDYRHCGFVIGSEPYCQRVADIIGAKYLPFDPDRALVDTRATAVREDPVKNYRMMSHVAQRFFRTRIVVFGAESTGKTTLSKDFASVVRAPWVHEYARPYLETIGPEITVDSMKAIWQGQRNTQDLVYNTPSDSPYTVLDTDLYTTIGYWEQPHWSDLGPVPGYLKIDAEERKADLYVITRSNIPFEADPLRYGGDHRESPDEYWIGVAEKYDLNYVVLENSDRTDRIYETLYYVWPVRDKKLAPLKYTRA